ncbi:tRNA (guanine(37)-N1)-methyltransferase isoform X1 [Chiloscyllium plagiosum]|uniref:tRNA (guanine(37)-N1)-methyltransferase isoform X1 n=1 Tax=Chiloscyllium plagiosum TaxID=36176 RepID=UPI001CB80DF9|nr:tRNA (guanine(37)-N1)-methyltransferase isoform X1 [Chiloscyllium plagiosum]
MTIQPLVIPLEAVMRFFLFFTKTWTNTVLRVLVKKLATRQQLQLTPLLPPYLSSLCISKAGVTELNTMSAYNPEEDVNLYTPPTTVRGITELNRDLFRKNVALPALKVKKDVVNKVTKSLKNSTLKRPGLKRVVEDSKDEMYRFILLDPCRISCMESFEISEKAVLKEYNVDLQIHMYHLEMTYEHFKPEEILKAVLPEGQDVTSGFSRVGHIVHMNLRDHQLPYKYLIGQVIMDKNPGVTSVVNKTNIIDNTYRNFQMEVLAGEDNMIAKVKENNITYEFDFSKVYWNPRLSTEHSRIVGLLNSGDLVYDMFAGVGPFAIPAAKKNCRVMANDLNPESYKWLVHNCKLNKVDNKVQSFNMDGRDFLLGPVKKDFIKQIEILSSKENKTSIHIIMNLPGLAIEFLDVFRQLFEKQNLVDALPTVHCYSFSKSNEPAKDIQRRAEDFLGTSLEGRCSIHLVRNVAPNKEMMCISFKVPAEVLCKNYLAERDNTEEPAPKRLRPDEVTASEGPQ